MASARSIFIVVLLLASRTDAANDIDSLLRPVHRGTARRFVTLARKAAESGQDAAARRIFERVLELHPTNTGAREWLGYEREKGEWRRDRDTARKVGARKDADPRVAEVVRERARELEERHSAAVARVVRKAGAVDACRDRLLGLLDLTPRNAKVHEALGHERIGDHYVRPGLVDAVRGMEAREAAFAACRDLAPPYEHLERKARLMGVHAPVPLLTIDRRTIGAVYSDRGNRRVALAVPPAHALLREILGPEAGVWDPQTIYFLTRGDYRRHLVARHGDDPDLDGKLLVSTYDGGDYFVFNADNAAIARDLYVHSAGYYTLEILATPADEEGNVRNEDWTAYGWIKEGFGYLLTLELLDSAETWFITDFESSAKLRYSVPPPEPRTRASCLAWVRAHLLEGTAFPLREVCGRTLNNLDLLASMEAWTFLRFLAHYSPEGIRKLPGALRRQRDGTPLRRADLALQEAVGKTLSELEPLWRAFTLEID